MCSRFVALLWLVLASLGDAGLAAAQDSSAEPAVSDRRVTARIARAFPPGREEQEIALTTRDGSPELASLDALSILARPHSVEPPAVAATAAEGGTVPETDDAGAVEAPLEEGFVAPGIKRLDPGLLLRLARIAERFPGRRIDIVSGYRPRARRGSRHRQGRALDVRIEGVAKEELTEVLRTVPETGVGFYPNSDLTHVDVREQSHYWVDRSGPGQRPDYGTWPPPDTESTEERREVMAAVRDALGTLREDAHGDEEASEEPAEAGPDTAETDPVPSATDDVTDEPPMTDAECIALRASIREALRALR